MSETGEHDQAATPATPNPSATGDPTAPVTPSPSVTAGLPQAVEDMKATIGEVATRFRDLSVSPSRVPTTRLEACLYGAAQPIVAVRLLVRHGELMRRAIVPALAFAALCVGLAVDEATGGTWSVIERTYLALVAAAPISPILFSRSYARLAAKAQTLAGYGERDPYLRSFRQAGVETMLQLIVLGIGTAPVMVIMALLPFDAVGVALVTGLWGLHWIFVEAFDSARTTPAGRPFVESEHDPNERPPWYERITNFRWPAGLGFLGGPLRWWGRMLGRLTRRWWSEVAIGERHPWMAVGFSACAALILALPGINLFFRPVVVIAAALVAAELDDGKQSSTALDEGQAAPRLRQ